ncbi:MAG TPA: CHAT domain-containing protein [Terriglobales bacterium]|nr:CHAT domain-containing protein [Terriglobales bacterium]
MVEKIAKNSEGERAGLREGDVLLNWRREDIKGEFVSPFDFDTIIIEELPRGAVTLEGLRGKDKQIWVLKSHFVGVQVRANLTKRLLTVYLGGKDLASAGKLTQAAGIWRQSAEAQKSCVLWLSAWLLFHSSEELARGKRWRESNTTYKEAIQHAADAGPLVVTHILRSWAWSLWSQHDLVSAENYYLLAIDESQESGKDLITASILINVGIVAFYRGDLAQAEEYLQRSLLMDQKLAPDSFAVAESLGNLGIVAYERGNFASAEDYYRQSLAIEEKLAPIGGNVAAKYLNLAIIAQKRGDLAKAEEYYRKTLTMHQNLLRDGPMTANILAGLAEVVRDRGSETQARIYLHQALEIFNKYPDSFYLPYTLDSLGEMAERHGDLAKAEKYYGQALAIREKENGPANFHNTEPLNHLGGVARKLGNLAKAEQYYRRALAILNEKAPGSVDHAESLAALAAIMRRKQRPDAAAQFYERALSVLENQTAHLGGTEENRSGFRAKYADYYKNYIDLLLTQKQPEHAFHVLERLRARSLLETLAQAHADIRKGVDPALVEKERSLQESLNAKSSRRIKLSGDQQAKEQLAIFDKEINDLLAQYKDVEEQIRANSPSYAALTQPQPLSAKEVQEQLLDADTLLLEYSLGEEHSYVFALTPDSLNAYELAKRAEIEKVARHAYELLTEHNRKSKGESARLKQAHLAQTEAEYSRTISELSRMVLGPLAGQLQGKRLLIVSDGALQYIPFSVLPLPSGSGSKASVPLVAGHEIVNLPSASVLAVLRREELERKAASKTVAVLADPVFTPKDDRVSLTAGDSRPKSSTPAKAHPSGPQVIPEMPEQSDLDRSAQQMGINGFPRLPFTRREADAISSVAPAGDVTEDLDFDASKATALSPQLKDYRIVHFATHGLLNNEHPELSGLVFSLVDKQGKEQDGFLRMLDIYNMELNADLVVLSACQTALGKEIGEEGLVGLTRGFMYAGAPRVVASLWKVDDEATAELMKKFYEGMLRDHQTPAQALRSAQQWMRTQKAWQAPYYWAGFVLQGEWK